MMLDTSLEEIEQAVINSRAEEISTLTENALAKGVEPIDIIEKALVQGMQIVGEKYEAGEYFLPHLIISADGMKKAMEILEPHLESREQKIKHLGTVVIGTVKGDIHEIGKTLVATILSANGYRVHDLGVDVSVDTFIQAIREFNADVIGLSALLTTTMTIQKDVIEALKKEGLRDSIKVVIGGAPVTSDWASKIGADGFADSAVSAVDVLKKML
jgi:corrinoid protein of di/trimethylamine methyltransferase